MDWQGKPLKGSDPGFLRKVEAAAAAQGATAIYVYSAKRTPKTNGGVSRSNHLTGHAIDARALVGNKWVPLGTLIHDVSTAYGLRSGDTPGFYKGARDPNHVDDGSNVNGGKPLPASKQGFVETAHVTRRKPIAAQGVQTDPYAEYNRENAISSSLANVGGPQPPSASGPPLASAPGQEEFQYAQPRKQVTEFWRMIGGQQDISPDTARYAQLGGYADGS